MLMNRVLYFLGLCLFPVCLSAQDYLVIAQPVVCMIQTDEVQSVVVEPSAAISSDDNVIVQSGFVWQNPEKIVPTGLQKIKKDDISQTRQIFNIIGQKLEKLQKGIIIINKRKVIVK